MTRTEKKKPTEPPAQLKEQDPFSVFSVRLPPGCGAIACYLGTLALAGLVFWRSGNWQAALGFTVVGLIASGIVSGIETKSLLQLVSPLLKPTISWLQEHTKKIRGQDDEKESNKLLEGGSDHDGSDSSA